MQNPEIKLSVQLKKCREEAILFKGPGTASDFCDFLAQTFDIYEVGQRYMESCDFEETQEDFPISSNSDEWNFQVLPAHDRAENAAIIAVHFVGKGTFYV